MLLSVKDEFLAATLIIGKPSNKVLPIIKNFMPAIIAQQILSVQPIGNPIGTFKMNANDEPITKTAKAPLTINFNGVVYHRIGGPDMLYVSKFHQDARGFWLIASLFYNPSIDKVVELTCDGHFTESQFQETFYKRLFGEYKNNIIYWARDNAGFRYRDFFTTMCIKRMSFLGLKPSRYCRKINGRFHDVMKFKTAEDYAQFKFYFSDYFVD